MESVLVVDDDPAFCAQIVAFLEELLPGSAVVAVADGNAAMTRALDLRPQHVLLDVAMPGPSGISVANALAQALPSTRVVILSGTDNVDVPEGATYLRKDEHLEERLRELFA